MLLPFFQRLEDLHLATAIDTSGYFVAAINVMHLLALTLFIGAVLIVDLRLLGRGISKQPLVQVARDAQPWLIAGFLALFVTGVLQILATPMKAYYSPQFWFKMQLLVVAVIYTFTLRRKITMSDEKRVGPIWGKLVALVSISMWVMIAISGRLIGLLQ
jgi:hypothetical protein